MINGENYVIFEQASRLFYFDNPIILRYYSFAYLGVFLIIYDKFKQPGRDQKIGFKKHARQYRKISRPSQRNF